MTEQVRDTGWFKSSFSSADSDNCVEVRLLDGVVGVRDSKSGGAPVMWFERAAWSDFVAVTNAG